MLDGPERRRGCPSKENQIKCIARSFGSLDEAEAGGKSEIAEAAQVCLWGEGSVLARGEEAGDGNFRKQARVGLGLDVAGTVEVLAPHVAGHRDAEGRHEALLVVGAGFFGGGDVGGDVGDALASESLLEVGRVVVALALCHGDCPRGAEKRQEEVRALLEEGSFVGRQPAALVVVVDARPRVDLRRHAADALAVAALVEVPAAGRSGVEGDVEALRGSPRLFF
mmetsp:Transcript_30970/g.99917  ORF Transcript_30970/g.99917 Transcript_30970/m.99917 type:complete len:224 (-) Transcript_30970:708-1379(-)